MEKKAFEGPKHTPTLACWKQRGGAPIRYT